MVKLVTKDNEAVVLEIDKDVKNKFRWAWLHKDVTKTLTVKIGKKEDQEVVIEKLGDCISKCEIAGKAQCLYCNDLISYGPRGCFAPMNSPTGLRPAPRPGPLLLSSENEICCSHPCVTVCTKPWQKVPKQFRKYARISMKLLHKNKGSHPKLQKKIADTGVSPELQEFMQQFLLEWHAKLSHKSLRAVAMEMKEGERSLPVGLEREHFLWLCRFMVRWHRRHAGKCDAMAGWSSGDTTEGSSGDEAAGCGAWPRFHGHRHHFGAAMHGRHPAPPPPPFHPYHFPAEFGMPCPPPHPHAPMHGWVPPPPPPPPPGFPHCWYPGGAYGGGAFYGEAPNAPSHETPAEDGASTDDIVEHVTEGVKKL